MKLIVLGLRSHAFMIGLHRQAVDRIACGVLSFRSGTPLPVTSVAAALKERAEDLCWNIAAHHAIGLPGLEVKLRLIDRDARGGGGGWTPVNIRTALESLQRMQEEPVANCDLQHRLPCRVQLGDQ